MIPEQIPVNNHYGNNEATQFDFDFFIEDETQLKVTHTDFKGNETYPVLGVDYSIKSVGKKNGSYIEFPLADSKYNVLGWDLSTDRKELLTIELNIPIEQPAEYQMSGKLSLKNIEGSFDYLTRICQILYRLLDRALKVSESVTDMNMNLPLPVPDNVFKWNETGTALENYDIIGENNAFKSQLLSDVNNAHEEMNATIDNNKQDIQNQFNQYSTNLSNNLQDAITQIDELKTETVEEIATFEENTNIALGTMKDELNGTISEYQLQTNTDIEDFKISVTSTISTVQEAAEKINELGDSMNNVIEKADRVEALATEVSQKADSITATAQNLANKDLSNLSEAGEQRFSSINNSISEIENKKADKTIVNLEIQNINNTLETLSMRADTDLSNLTPQANAKLHYPVFCFNSGLVYEQGQSALCSLENDVLTQHSPCVCTTSDGQTFIVNEDVTLDISELSDGDYNVFYYPETREMKAYANTVYIQDYQPSVWVENDIWVDTSVMPYITKQNISGVVQIVKCIPNAHLARVSGGGVVLMLANYNNSQILTDWQNGIEKSIGTLTDTKANITDLDGKWHGTGIQIAQNQTISATSNYIYDLSNWLPNDGNNYEILLDCHAFISKNQVGKVISIIPSSLLQNNFYLCGVYSNNNNYQNDTFGSCYCPIGANRKLNITGKHSSGEGLFNLYGRGYRKIR